MFAIGIAVVLVVAAIGGLAARVMMGPEERRRCRGGSVAPCGARAAAGDAGDRVP